MKLLHLHMDCENSSPFSSSSSINDDGVLSAAAPGLNSARARVIARHAEIPAIYCPSQKETGEVSNFGGRSVYNPQSRSCSHHAYQWLIVFREWTTTIIFFNQGRAWAISLTPRSTLNGQIMKACFPGYSGGANDSLHYRSSPHGKGLNQFWSNVEGYDSPMLNLVAVYPHTATTNERIVQSKQ